MLTPERSLTYRELAAEVDEFGALLEGQRRLVLLAGGNDLPSLRAYLAVLGSGQVALPCDPAHADRLIDLYRPDTVVIGGEVRHHAERPQHDLHPDLALLLSTSGSTGSPKLVRLSHENLGSNAAAIASYLGLSGTDVAVTTLPPHYCYGLSVIHSHLSVGAALVLNEHSVVDASFWELAAQHQVTSLAGVPYTFDLLDRIGFFQRPLPSLRRVTQAGGRLAPSRVAAMAATAAVNDFDFVVMYGATEATARMAWLPPERAATAPDAIGQAIPGGHLRIDPMEEFEDGVGELVYSGPNVMLGYAEAPADLANGRTTHELRTGDIARQGEDGLFRIIGRRSRFAKVYGLRIDLDEVERGLDEEGVPARCADGGDHLVVALIGPCSVQTRQAVLAAAKRRWGLPAGAVVVLEMAAFPRLANDKVDYPAIAAAAAESRTPDVEAIGGASAEQRLCRVYAQILGTPVAPDDSFLSLGGDSLSYVEASIRVEEILGSLPPSWHRSSVAELAACATTRRRRGRQLEASVLLRAVAILAIVASHANLMTLLGGAHLLVGISGYNYGRFRPQGGALDRVRAHLSSAARIAIPSILWIGTVTLATGLYPWRSVFLVNGLLGPVGWSEPAWHFWFVEALLVILLALAALSTLRWWRQAEERWPFWLPLAVASVALITRYELWEPRGGDDIHRAHMVLWIFAIGCCIARAELCWQRLLVSAWVIAAVPGFFDNPARDGFVVAGLLALIWVRTVRVPRWVGAVLTTLASASLYIYLTHWQVYPWLEDRYPPLAVLASLSVGVAVAAAARTAGTLVRGTLSRRPRSAAAPAPALEQASR